MKNKVIHCRTTEDKYNIIKSRAMAGNKSITEYVIDRATSAEVSPLTDRWILREKCKIFTAVNEIEAKCLRKNINCEPLLERVDEFCSLLSSRIKDI